MTPSERLAAPSDPKARMVSIFVGAVLLPSIALSVVSFHAVPKQAEATKFALFKRAEHVLAYVEDDLERSARAKAREAAKAVGSERLLEGRPEEVRGALRAAGFEQPMFAALRLEASSRVKLPGAAARLGTDSAELREAVQAGADSGIGEESLPLSVANDGLDGVLRFRFECDYVHVRLLREYFERQFSNPFREMVVRVAEPDGGLLYETAPTPPDRGFEVKRVMNSPSFRGLTLSLRYRERSIQEEVRRWAVAKTVLIGFIDLMLGAGLLLVYSNVRREVHLSKLKSDFVANVSHELKTPLALIRLFSETLELGRVPNEDKRRQYYRVIHKESQRLTQLINNILDFSRIEAGRREYRFAETDLSRVVDDVLEAYRFQIEQHGFTLEVEIEEGLPRVRVDKEALGQALLNVVNNALKYSLDEKEIKVALRRQGEQVLIAVADRGIGIAKGEQRKVFEKFYRAEDSLVHETKGSGLGLALVRHIMEAHGGSVELESAPGRGSTFTLVLPLAQDSPGRAAALEREA